MRTGEIQGQHRKNGGNFEILIVFEKKIFLQLVPFFFSRWRLFTTLIKLANNWLDNLFKLFFVFLEVFNFCIMVLFQP
jgi:hypothetical protein